MRIATRPVPCVPAYVKKQAVPVPVSDARSAAPVMHLALGGPVGSVALYGMNNRFAFETAKPDQKKLVMSILRLISKPIADQLGHSAPLINSGIWLCIDFNALRKQIRETGTDRTQNLIDGTALAGDLAGAVSQVSQLDGLGKAGDVFQFFALVGDQAHHGGIGCNAVDLNRLMAAYQGDETQQGVLEVIDELCKL